MSSDLRRSSSVLCVLAWLSTVSPLQAAEDSGRKPDVGVVHAAGDEAWIDVPANLGDTWKATLGELKERGHMVDADLSYVESNGQIALESLWIAVLPGASLDVPITRVRMVVLVSAEDHEQHTAALVGAGALLGAIAERLPAASGAPSRSSVAQPAPAAPVDDATSAEPTAASDELVTTYNTYNTYDTYPNYGTSYPAYVSYAPSVVYVWEPWWWLGWCHSGWYFGWSTWGSSYWNTCWNIGWGWNSGCSPWWTWPSNPSCSSSWSSNPWWRNCNNNTTCVASASSTNLRVRNSFSQTPSLTFSGRSTRAGASGSDVASGTNRSKSSNDGGSRLSVSHRPSSALASVDAFPPRVSPSGERDREDRGSSSAHSGSAPSSRSIVVSERSSSGTRAKPGSVTKLKGVSLTTKLGAIHDADSLARTASVPSVTAASPGFSASSAIKPTSPFTIVGGGSSGGSSSRGASSSSRTSSRSVDPSPGQSSGLHSSSPPSIGSTLPSRSSASAPQPAPPHVSAPAPRSPSGSLGSSGGHSSGGSPGSMGGGSSGGGASSGGGSSHGSGRSSGKGPR